MRLVKLKMKRSARTSITKNRRMNPRCVGAKPHYPLVPPSANDEREKENLRKLYSLLVAPLRTFLYLTNPPFRSDNAN